MKLRLATLALLLTLLAAPAFGQGCAMCYSSAAGAAQKGQQALSHAVLILLIPTLGLIVGFTGMTVYFKDNYARAHEEQEAPGDDEL